MGDAILQLTEKTTFLQKEDVCLTLTLPYDLRQKRRQRAMLDNGVEAVVLLPRGTVLFDGDLLLSDTGEVVRVQAAEEELSFVECQDMLTFARACYHLGNRHVPLQIEEGRLAYPHDHVLDDMLRKLGLEVRRIQTSFEPEPGAYGGVSGHHHDH